MSNGAKLERNAEIRRLARPKERGGEGLRLGELARRFGISRQRVDQIIHPLKTRARQAVWDALKTGRLRRPKVCENCGQRGSIEAHHDNYRRPLDVRWLCRDRRCHSRAGGRKPILPHAQIVKLARQGLDARTIAAAMGLATSQVYNVASYYKIKLTRSKRLPRLCACGRRARIRGRCPRCAYHQDPVHRARCIAAVQSWQRRNPERVRVIQRRARRAYEARQRALRATT